MKKIIFVLLIATLLLAGCTYQTTTPTSTGTTTPTQSTNDTTNQTTAITATISIQNFSFNPSTLTISKGTTITWTNNDSMAHTVTGGELNSPVMAPGQTYTHTFNTIGTIDYICTIHPSMKGQIIVN
ncbi:MAG: cupredoxin family copper-binding protein [archaeon]